MMMMMKIVSVSVKRDRKNIPHRIKFWNKKKISPGLSTFKTLNSVVYLGCGKSVQTLNTGGDVTQKREKKEASFSKRRRRKSVFCRETKARFLKDHHTTTEKRASSSSQKKNKARKLPFVCIIDPLSLFIHHNTYIYIYIGARVSQRIGGQYFSFSRESFC